jgi:hypothetical protein
MGRIAQFGTAAAVVTAGWTMKGGVRDLTNRRQTTPTAAAVQWHRFVVIKTMFARANTVSEFNRADELWNNTRPELMKYEHALNCEDYGQAHDQELMEELVDGLVERPVTLIVDIGKLVLEIAAVERDEALDTLAKTVKDLGQLVEDKGQEKIGKLTSAERAKIVGRFREALLKYLQRKLKRSRAYFLRIIGDICSIAETYSSMLIDLGRVALTSARINPEDCGNELAIERERDAALKRVFSSPKQSMLIIPR